MRAQQVEMSADHRISVATRQRDIIVMVAGARMVKLWSFGDEARGRIFTG